MSFFVFHRVFGGEGCSEEALVAHDGADSRC
jgi:hypothetical protein